MEGSSPIRDAGSPGPDFLTPRTKLAKMLADIDDEVDSAPTPSPTKKQQPTDTTPPSLVATNQGPSLSIEHVSGAARPTDQCSPPSRRSGRADSNDDSDDDVRRPLGRAARRMQTHGRSSASASPTPRSSPPPRRANRPFADDQDDLYSVTPQKALLNRRIGPGGSAAPGEDSGLFVSPAKPDEVGDDTEDELPSNPIGSKERLAELIAEKRAERKEREAEERRRRKQQKRDATATVSSDLPDEAVEGPGDAPNPDIERIMSDASRPARKASKKALLEMERETQRIARQQALAHQMKVKKKFTTNDLFARFNMRGPQAAGDTFNEEHRPGADSTASSAPNSDGIEERPANLVSTPPSSPPPPTPFDKQKALVEQGALSKLVPVREDSLNSIAQMVSDDEELPDVADIGKASQRPELPKTAQPSTNRATAKGIARLGKIEVKSALVDSDDDDLEIIPRLPPHLRAFERAKGATGNRSADSKAVHNLRHLAHLNYDDSKPRQRKGTRPSISHNALEARLRKQAKEQARQQHLERIEELRAKGIEIQTHEEKEREAEEMEDLLEKARIEAQALRKLERKGAEGDEGAMEASEDEDEDFEPDASDEDQAGDRALPSNNMVDEAAEETDEDEDDELEGSEEELDEPEDPEHGTDTPLQPETVHGDVRDIGSAQPRKARQSRVVADDEEEEDELEDQQAPVSQTPKATPSQADPFAAFGFGAVNESNALLSPTQAFNATMQTPTQDTQEDSFDILRRIAPPTGSTLPPTLPDLDSQTQMESQFNTAFAGSQVPESQRIQLNWETQAPETPRAAGMGRGASALSETPTWEPTQDQGLQSPWTVAPRLRRDDARESIAEQDTQSTVAMRVSESPAPSQTLPRSRGKLTRRQAPVVDSSDDEAEAQISSIRPEKRNAFREMARKRKEALSAAERAEADKELRGMMEDQAEESEDEYAGLGGDDFVAPETEADREIIDSSAVEVDERALAAHYAERERERNEAETSRLYKDITTGVLRRKMGANAFDLEEDEDELAVRRRRMRQQEEARKRKALLKDDNVKTLAEGRQSKGKDAFLKAIADDDGDEEMVGLSDDEGADAINATQEDSQPSQTETQQAGNVLQETSGNKRRLAEGEESYERPPAKQRRTAPSVGLRRPTSMLEVQESVSFLLDEPQTAALAAPTTLEPSDSEQSEQDETDHNSGNEDDLVAAEEARQNDGGFAPNPLATEAKARKDSIDMPPPPPRLPANQRRTAAPTAKASVIDRLSLKRASSTSETMSGHGRAAWGGAASSAGFKAPSLLRRATTNSGANDRGVTTNAAAAGKTLSRENSSGVRQGGSKKSSLAYQARVEERKAIVEASARRREENTKRIAAMRRAGSGAGAGGGRGWGGAFE